MTRQRALILDIMREKCPEHMTADEIFRDRKSTRLNSSHRL